jgi:ribose transport system permease protein
MAEALALPRRPAEPRFPAELVALALPAVALLAMLGIIVYARPAVLSYFGLSLLFNLSAPLILASLSQMLVICLGDIDLSNGAFVSFVTCVTAVFMNDARRGSSAATASRSTASAARTSRRTASCSAPAC